MRITTCLLPSPRMSDGDSTPTQQGADAEVAVVIDVLRATTVMVTALASGASQIMTFSEIDEAREAVQRLARPSLLCGERGCKRIEGFDLGNSPTEYVPDRVADHVLALTTTNGTRAIASVEAVPKVLIAGFVNLNAVLKKMAGWNRVHLVCAGTDGQLTLEDVLLAGAIVWLAQEEFDVHLLDDDSLLARQLWQSWFPKALAGECLPDAIVLSERLRETRGGRNLVRLGYQDDLQYCAKIDAIPVVPERISKSPMTFALMDGISTGRRT